MGKAKNKQFKVEGMTVKGKGKLRGSVKGCEKLKQSPLLKVPQTYPVLHM